jgi:hypothetical protein
MTPTSPRISWSLFGCQMMDFESACSAGLYLRNRREASAAETVGFDHLLQPYLSSLSSIQCGEKRETILRVLSEGTNAG